MWGGGDGGTYRNHACLPYFMNTTLDEENAISIFYPNAFNGFHPYGCFDSKVEAGRKPCVSIFSMFLFSS